MEWCGGSRIKKKSENGVAVAFVCAPLARFLRTTFGSRAATKRLPTAWLGLSDDLKVEILRGVMYGDGSPSDSQYTLGITSRELANQIYLILLSFGIASSYQVHRSYRGSDGVFHREAYFVRVRHTNEIKKLEALLPMMPMGIGKAVDKKSIWIEDGFLHCHVRKRTEAMYKGKVYNLEVDSANSYCTQGATLHNCFPRDNIAFAYQASKIGAQAWLADATHKINLSQVQRIIALAEAIVPKHTEKVGVLGLSYKPRTNVVEQSQSLMIARRLGELGYKVSVFDPAAMESARKVLGDSVQYSRSAEDCVRSSDLVVLATPWPEFQKLNARLFKGKAVLDCWRFFGEQVRETSSYTSVGIASGLDA